jgi:hypothetical protein
MREMDRKGDSLFNYVGRRGANSGNRLGMITIGLVSGTREAALLEEREERS